VHLVGHSDGDARIAKHKKISSTSFEKIIVHHQKVISVHTAYSIFYASIR